MRSNPQEDQSGETFRNAVTSYAEELSAVFQIKELNSFYGIEPCAVSKAGE